MKFIEPSRKIPKNYRNITGKFASKKSERLISYESKLERDFLYLFEFENIVLKIVEQPITLQYNTSDSRMKYTPDFYLKTPSGQNDILLEVKYYNELKKTFSDSKPKYKAITKHIENNRVDFYFYTDRCPMIQSEGYMFNIHFLLNYNSLPIEHYYIIKDIFNPYMRIQDILNEYSTDRYVQLTLLNSVWCMIRRKILLVNLYEKLSTRTTILQLRKYDEKVYQAHLEGRVIKGYLL